MDISTATLYESIPISDIPAVFVSPYVIVLEPPIASTGIPPSVCPTVPTLTKKSAPPLKVSTRILSPAVYPWPGFTILASVILPLAIVKSTINPEPVPPVVAWFV